MSKIDVFLLDNLNSTKEELKIIKAKTYVDLLIQLRQVIKNLPKNYETFILDKDNKEIKINNEEKFKKIDDILFIRELTQERLEQSILEINSNNIYESDQLISGKKYDCILCSVKIKNEKPYLCYKCQRIFHEKCLKDWDTDFKAENNNNLLCPNCKEELPLECWNKKFDYEIHRKDINNLMNKMNEYKLKNNMNDNLIIIKDKKIKELKNEINNKSELIKKYENDMNKAFEIFRDTLNRINSINSNNMFSNLDCDDKTNDLINKYPLNSVNINLDDISSAIAQKLENLNMKINFIFSLNVGNNMPNFPGFNNFNNNQMNFPPFQFPSQFQQFPYQTSNQEEQIIFWDIIFKKSNENRLVIQIKNNKTLEEAINHYRIKSGDMISNKFTFNGKPLDYNLTLSQSGLSNKSIIHVEEKETPFRNPLSLKENEINLIFEQKTGGQVLTIQISLDKLVGDAIKKYKNKIFAQDKLKFIYNGDKLNENLTVREAGLRNGSKILVIIPRDIC